MFLIVMYCCLNVFVIVCGFNFFVYVVTFAFRVFFFAFLFFILIVIVGVLFLFSDDDEFVCLFVIVCDVFLVVLMYIFCVLIRI